jgi:hypothetical protein
MIMARELFFKKTETYAPHSMRPFFKNSSYSAISAFLAILHFLLQSLPTFQCAVCTCGYVGIFDTRRTYPYWPETSRLCCCCAERFLDRGSSSTKQCDNSETYDTRLSFFFSLSITSPARACSLPIKVFFFIFIFFPSVVLI